MFVKYKRGYGIKNIVAVNPLKRFEFTKLPTKVERISLLSCIILDLFAILIGILSIFFFNYE